MDIAGSQGQLSCAWGKQKQSDMQDSLAVFRKNQIIIHLVGRSAIALLVTRTKEWTPISGVFYIAGIIISFSQPDAQLKNLRFRHFPSLGSLSHRKDTVWLLTRCLVPFQTHLPSPLVFPA